MKLTSPVNLDLQACLDAPVSIPMAESCADNSPLQLATAVQLVRMVLVIRLQEARDPTLDFVRLSLFAYVDNNTVMVFPGFSLSASIHCRANC